MRQKFQAICLIITLIFLMVGCSKNGEDEISSTEKEYTDLLQFSATTYTDEFFTEENLKEYDVTAIYFWAPWSELSVAELKHLTRLNRELPEYVHIMTGVLDLNKGGYPTYILENAQFPKKLSIMGGTADYNMLTQKIDKLPTTVFMNKKGEIVGKPIEGIHLNYYDFYEDYITHINAMLVKRKKIDKNNNYAVEEEYINNDVLKKDESVKKESTEADIDE